MKRKSSYAAARRALHAEADPGKADVLQRFFKTGPGDYGEGDVFLGVQVPQVRRIAKGLCDMPYADICRLLHSDVHEERLLALLIFVQIYQSGDEVTKKQVYDLYLENTEYINNWDLVDLSAHHVPGDYLLHRNREPLRHLARSSDIWERRIAIVSTFRFIRENDFTETLRIADTLLEDKEDLIRKAVGWMLREVGNRDLAVEENFLKPRYDRMPRTMLRYAIERFPEAKRQRYLKGTI